MQVRGGGLFAEICRGVNAEIGENQRVSGEQPYTSSLFGAKSSRQLKPSSREHSSSETQQVSTQIARPSTTAQLPPPSHVPNRSHPPIPQCPPGRATHMRPPPHSFAPSHCEPVTLSPTAKQAAHSKTLCMPLHPDRLSLLRRSRDRCAACRRYRPTDGSSRLGRLGSRRSAREAVVCRVRSRSSRRVRIGWNCRS